jgi:hypothetical protein
MTSLIEVVVCSLIFSMLIAGLLTLTSVSSTWGLKTQTLMIDTLNIDATVEYLQDDVKSSESVTVEDDDLVIQQAEKLIIYTYANGKLYRNSLLMMERLATCTFTPADGDSVIVYLMTKDGEVMNLTLHR